ncbi:MAG: hypothetical protein ACRD6W_16520, partial [Nitrososphaerales archaeon]
MKRGPGSGLWGSYLEYARLKHSLAHLIKVERTSYVEAKEPFIWETIRLADMWAQPTSQERRAQAVTSEFQRVSPSSQTCPSTSG